MYMKFKGFTLVETLIVIVMIGLLSMAMMTYLWGNDERVLKYKAEWCVKTIDGKLQNFLNFALTSKSFSSWWNLLFSPDYYYLVFSWVTDKIFSQFSFLGKTLSGDQQVLWTISRLNCMNELDKDLRFEITWNYFTGIVMSKWFRPVTVKDTFTFILTTGSTANGIFTGEVLVKLCETEECKKEIAKWIFDARVQSIFLKMCLFYKEGSLDECETWES